MNEKEKSVLAAVEKAIGNGWHFKKLMPLARGTFGNVYELAKNNPMIGPDYRAVKIVPTSKKNLNISTGHATIKISFPTLIMARFASEKPW